MRTAQRHNATHRADTADLCALEGLPAACHAVKIAQWKKKTYRDAVPLKAKAAFAALHSLLRAGMSCAHGQDGMAQFMCGFPSELHGMLCNNYYSDQV